MIKVKFPKEQVAIFNSMGTIVNTASGNVYRYFPYWVRETEEEGVFELFLLGKLPDELVNIIIAMRE